MFSKAQRTFATTVSEIINCNPFLECRIKLERKALGADFDEENAAWNLHPSQHQQTPNLDRISRVAEDVLADTYGGEFGKGDLDLYVDLVRFVLFDKYRLEFEQAVNGQAREAKVYEKFKRDWLDHFPSDRTPDSVRQQVPHIFALLCQIRRAFNNIFQNLIGSSEAIIQLRANVWRSIFTHDVRRYYRSMFSAMADFPTLITGPTGSGKELVARAIGQSGYVPFNPETGKWATPPDQLFVSLNLSALSPTLIESELFGHAKGSFTGATSDRTGWLESCPVHGAVFLDEIGELDPEVQVKLLRVVQDRAFQRLGDTTERRFHGRIIAATNRDLAMGVQDEKFRIDFYYRLCADQIQTPSLVERCSNANELSHLVEHLLLRILPETEAPEAARQCVAWIRERLGPRYEWPGNVRELDQCIRSWLIRQDYAPLAKCGSDGDQLAAALANSQLTAEELVSLYCCVSYGQTGSYVQTANQLNLDRRTVKARVHPPDADPED